MANFLAGCSRSHRRVDPRCRTINSGGRAWRAPRGVLVSCTGRSGPILADALKGGNAVMGLTVDVEFASCAGRDRSLIRWPNPSAAERRRSGFDVIQLGTLAYTLRRRNDVAVFQAAASATQMLRIVWPPAIEVSQPLCISIAQWVVAGSSGGALTRTMHHGVVILLLSDSMFMHGGSQVWHQLMSEGWNSTDLSSCTG
jgi:hypothetical protein